jgi:glycosyltransferase involved in cell wall biosynthesis
LTSSILAAESIALGTNTNVKKNGKGFNLLWIVTQTVTRYKPITTALFKSLKDEPVACKIKLWKWRGFAADGAATGLRRIGYHLKRLVKIIIINNNNNNKITPSDVVVIESYTVEMLPFVIQCFGFGVPVVILNGEVPKEVTGNPAVKVFANSSDPDTFQAGIIDIISNPEMLEDLRTKSLQFAARHHNWEDFKKQLAAFYR